MGCSCASPLLLRIFIDILKIVSLQELDDETKNADPEVLEQKAALTAALATVEAE